MSAPYSIQSSDPKLLEKARRIARDFAEQYEGGDVVGIAFLGAIARGYFDRSADIDIVIFQKEGSTPAANSPYLHIDDIEVHRWLADYGDEVSRTWDMGKRWTYSQAQIHYDPEGRIAKLLSEKVPLRPDEQRWLLMSGATLSEWYINRLTQTWVERGNLVSAHHMFHQGLEFFFDMLFALNGELIPDMKWRYYCAVLLKQLPSDFRRRVEETMLLKAVSVRELERRKTVFMGMWSEMIPLVERALKMPYAEFSQLV